MVDRRIEHRSTEPKVTGSSPVGCIGSYTTVGGYSTDGKSEGSEMLNVKNRTLISTKEAARLYGCTPGRIRQLARAGVIWSHHLTTHMTVLDADEIRSRAKKLATTGRPRKHSPAA